MALHPLLRSSLPPHSHRRGLSTFSQSKRTSPSSFSSTHPHTTTKWTTAAGLLVTGCGCCEIGRRRFGSSRVLCEEDKGKLKKGDQNSLFPSLPSFSLPSFSFPSPSLSLPSFSFDLDSIKTPIKIFNTVQSELSKSPDSLYSQVASSRLDPQLHPEVQWDAEVRLGNELGSAERAFLRNRKREVRGAFAKFIGVDEGEVDERDIPIISVAGSGGGYRAMIYTLGSIAGMKESGLWDTVTYCSAVSGSCWALNSLLSVGGGNVERTIRHLEERIQKHFLDTETLELLIKPPTNKYLLSGLILKDSSENGNINLVDAYGTLLSSRLYLPSSHTPSFSLSPHHLKISHQREHIDLGQGPLPIYCIIRHEVPDPDTLEKKEKEMKEHETEKGRREARGEVEGLVGRSRWQWFEVSPYETGCDEIGAWIPTWSLGRTFENGKNVDREPELSLAIMSGIFASAFCATLFSYFKEIRPLISTLPYFSTVESWLLSNYDSALDSIHPFPPSDLPNFLKGIDVAKLKEGTEEHLTRMETLGFMDAGANLNVPYVPLFRRDCDIILAIDASADSQELWFERAQEYATERQLDTWPRVQASSLFPALEDSPTPRDPAADGKNTSEEKGLSPTPTKPSPNSQDPAKKVDEAKAQERDTDPKRRAELKREGKDEGVPKAVNPDPVKVGSAPHSASPTGQEEGAERKPAPTSDEDEPPLGACNIWIGNSKDSNSSCRNDSPTVDSIVERDGIALAYFPLEPDDKLPNPTEVWSTWNFEYKKEETRELIELARRNQQRGEGQLKVLLEGVWRRKMKQRREREGKEGERVE